MNTPIQRLLDRLAHRADSEHGQALIRIAVLFVVLLYLFWHGSGAAVQSSALTRVFFLVAAGFGVGLALLLGILTSPGVSHVRRALGMVSDYGLMAAAMIGMGEPLAWVYIIIMWVTVGNGLRYGNRYLYAAMVAAAASFGSVLVFNDYWRSNLNLGIGLWVGLIAVPSYLSGLLRALMRATREARRANEAKSRFLANMSHEFRTPLSGLSGVSQLMAATRLDPEQREYLAIMQASTRSLLSLVEDVLDISAIEAGKLKLNCVEFSLSELLDGIGAILQPTVRGKHLVYESNIAEGVPDALRGDASHLRQVLLNLAGNAVKFTEQGSVRLDVAIAAQLEDFTRLRFTIVDTGIGVPAGARARLFEAFEQADATLSRRYGGTGLGTTIAKGLTEAMGGTIGFESTEHAGSRFWVELSFEAAAPIPVNVTEAESGQAAIASPTFVEPVATENVIAFSDPFLRHRARVRSLRLLIADDHAANRMVLERLLQKAGHNVVSVANGDDVFAAMETNDYDAVILDLHMPGRSGLDLLKHMRVMQSGGPLTPVIVHSADATPESILRCEQAGARAFLAKPLVAVRLLDILAEVAQPGSRTVKTAMASHRGSVPMAEDVLDPVVLEDLSALGMGSAFEQEFIGQCLRDTSDCLSGIGRAGNSDDLQALRDHAHALKGVASSLGLVRLTNSSSELMRLADWQLRREWKTRLNALWEQHAEGRRALVARGHTDAARDSGRDPA